MNFWTKTAIDLQRTLFTGQSFLWHRINNEYYHVLNGNLISLSSTSDGISFRVHNPILLTPPVEGHTSPTSDCKVENPTKRIRIEEEATTNRLKLDNIEQIKQDLDRYFNLQVDLSALHQSWCKDTIFKQKTKSTLSRILNQDPIQTIFQFICSQNNNIKRISKLCHKLTTFGDFITEIDGIAFHVFPTLEQLSKVSEDQWRECGFGYRAKYIEKSAYFLLENKDFIPNLLELEYKQAKEQLLLLPGGPKVADCICLFGLSKADCIPVDTHVYQIATKDYGLKIKSLNKKSYEEIGDFFREKFEYAGWAHTLLFIADLKSDSMGNTLDGVEEVKG